MRTGVKVVCWFNLVFGLKLDQTVSFSGKPNRTGGAENPTQNHRSTNSRLMILPNTTAPEFMSQLSEVGVPAMLSGIAAVNTSLYGASFNVMK